MYLGPAASKRCPGQGREREAGCGHRLLIRAGQHTPCSPIQTVECTHTICFGHSLFGLADYKVSQSTWSLKSKFVISLSDFLASK